MRNIFKEAKDSCKALKALHAENESCQKELNNLASQLATINAKLSANINKLQMAVQNGEDTSKLQQENENLEKEITVLKEQLSKLTNKLKSLKKDLEKI